MARIDLTTIKKIEKDKAAVHQPVTATYSVFENNGEKYIQIDTYGKNGRVMPEKISQSFQIDRGTALFLRDLLKNEFSLEE